MLDGVILSPAEGARYGHRCIALVMSALLTRSINAGPQFYLTYGELADDVGSYSRGSIASALRELRADGRIATRSDGRGLIVRLIDPPSRCKQGGYVK